MWSRLWIHVSSRLRNRRASERTVVVVRVGPIDQANHVIGVSQQARDSLGGSCLIEVHERTTADDSVETPPRQHRVQLLHPRDHQLRTRTQLAKTRTPHRYRLSIDVDAHELPGTWEHRRLSVSQQETCRAAYVEERMDVVCGLETLPPELLREEFEEQAPISLQRTGREAPEIVPRCIGEVVGPQILVEGDRVLLRQVSQ